MSSDSSASPVSFTVGSETQIILRSLDEFVEHELRPLAEDIGDTLTNPRRGHDTDGRLTDEYLDAIETVREKSGEAGFYAMNLPEGVGGSGVPAVTWYRAMKHMYAKGRGLTEHVLAGPEGPKPLLTLADEAQRERYVHPAVRGEKSTAFAQTEPGVGSDSPNMATSAEREGDGWIINGTNQWITNGPYADFAQVFARTTAQSEANRYGGITCFLVERDEFEVRSLNNAPGRSGYRRNSGSTTFTSPTIACSARSIRRSMTRWTSCHSGGSNSAPRRSGSPSGYWNWPSTIRESGRRSVSPSGTSSKSRR